MTHVPKILIRFIDGEKQRYATPGDYTYDADADTITIFVSLMDDWRSELAVAVHELVESVACLADDVDFMEIDGFDVQFEKARMSGTVGEEDEPGDSVDAPYRIQHAAATFVEREVCSQLKLPWVKHEQTVQES